MKYILINKKKRKIKFKILFFIFIILNIIFSIKNYAKYNYIFKIKAFSLQIQENDIVYEIIKSNNEPYTNQDVEIVINFNKEINNVYGFELSNNRKRLSRIVQDNEKNTFFVSDDFGNKIKITYDINNIDKVIPEIIGIDDNKVYNKDIEINYKDNIGIQEILVLKILDNNQTVEEKNPYKLTNNGTYKIIVKDLAGNINEKVIKIEKPYNIEYKNN